ncbi:hypothetical protein BDM02DRAFT_3269586 [Thelephora ganbajun]|uniref:Uncharacterized protein n=1 Tax=Thelephora ganbajun TaxID=370292 RepID=A0ACB6ZFL5_THEGA|nr:hypothetical protein BDM02DRAFT_3269586 [Thelephora ganbajun]
MTTRKTRSTRTQKKIETGSGLLSPPSSTGDKAGDRDAAGPSPAMISPPPEEDEDQRPKPSVFVELPPPESASKRKRLASASSLLNLTGDPNTPATTGEPSTPNPKARKQSRRSKSLLSSDSDSGSPIHDSPTKNATAMSPHVSNPQADYIPPGPSYARHVLAARNRRSATPIPPYEPPTDRFTPPREIIVQPSSAQKKKPRQPKKKIGKQLKLQIKDEPPEIDLNAQIPPPSPTDDPLLLRGPPRSSRARSLPKQSRGISPIRPSEIHEKTPPPPDEPSTLPNSSPWSEVDVNNIDFPPVPLTSDSMTPDPPEEHPEEPVWQEGPSGWTESSDNEEPTFDQEGEYTGKFTSYVVPTKPDPPTTVQRERQEAWGRPISPFPYPTNRKSRWSSPLTPAETQEESQMETQEPEQESEKQPALDIADLTMTPHDAEGDQLFGSDQNTAQEEKTASSDGAAVRQVLIPTTVQPMFNFDGLSSPDHSYETPIRPPKEKPVPFITFFPKRTSIASSSKTTKTHFPPPQRSFIFNSPARNVADLERDEESFVDRALSQAPEDEEEDDNATELPQRVPHLQQLDAPGEDTEGEDEDVIDLGVIKISSEDPMAAAKAAAILKLHDYDLVKRTHRRNLLASGISKTSPRKRSKGNDSFVRPISPAALPELIKEAETELEKSFTGSGRFMTPIRANLSVASTSDSRFTDPSRFDPMGPREWGKNDWKILDACFTDERLDVAEKMGMAEGSLADVTDVRLDDVVNRFVEAIGGDAVLVALGPSWTRKDILKRARALEKKQGAGKGAPGTPRRSHTPFSEMSGHMEIPDFTPIGPRRVADRLDEGNFKLPATLLAPRYSHLMDEAVAISRGTGGEPSGSSSGVAVKAPPDSPGLFRRLASPLFSYLPLLSKGTSDEASKDAEKSGLPLPPPELFEKERDPIVTPASKVLPKPTHPKDQVELHSVPPKPSMIPKPKTRPKRMVDLRPVSPKSESVPLTKSLVKDRRQSGGSVKDLVKGFETLDESVSSLKSSTRSVQSINEWRADGLGIDSKGEGSSKPQWKP